MNSDHKDNLYARNLNDEIVFISRVERGRKGYFCLGCKGQMQAVKPQKKDIRPYFRHDVKYDSQSKGCTYSDETYRHKLAKEILQIEKRVKVPALYKYPPIGVEGTPNLIYDSGYIIASSVSIEMYFFENENGEIAFGKKDTYTEDKYLLVKPDVTFFDSKGNPILFIEITATHKVDETKRNKYKRLGIDAIEVLIPKDSPEEIAKTFHITERTKWIYNNEHEKRQYIYVPLSPSEGIQPSDEIQRKFFEESFKCRSAQIRNLIYSIGICLETEQYKGIKRSIESEISRVERNTKEAQIEWKGICNSRIGEVKKQFREEEETIESEEIEFQKKINDLEGRYFRKSRELDENISKLRSEDDDFEREKRNIEDNIREEEIRIGEIISKCGKMESESDNFENIRYRIIERFKKSERDEQIYFSSEESRIANRIVEQREFNKGASSKYEIDRVKFMEEIDRNERRVIDELSARYRQCIGEVENREFDETGIDRSISRKITDFYEAMSLLKNIASIYRDKERFRIAYEAIKSGEYKDWIKKR
jgi:hypothetical protein